MDIQAVFLDRDGVLNADSHGFIRAPDDVVLLPGAAAALARLNQAGLPVIVITNQSGVGRGYFSLAELELVHERLRTLLAAEGARFDDLLLCPHAPDEGCACRKPEPGMLREAAGRHGLDLARCVFVGDRSTDVLAARAAGTRAVLVLTAMDPERAQRELREANAWPDCVAADLSEAVEWILTPCGS